MPSFTVRNAFMGFSNIANNKAMSKGEIISSPIKNKYPSAIIIISAYANFSRKDKLFIYNKFKFIKVNVLYKAMAYK